MEKVIDGERVEEHVDDAFGSFASEHDAVPGPPLPPPPAVPRPAPAERGNGVEAEGGVPRADGRKEPGPMVNALTIDFEDWYQGLEIPHTEWGGFEDRIPRVGRRLLEILAEAGVRGTFFVLGYVAEQHPELVREIHAAGHEVATHGQYHRMVYRDTPEVFRRDIRRAVSVLEDLTGEAVRGHRAPYFSITNQSLWALDILAELGLSYDSSIFPIHNYRYGIADAPRWPHRMSLAGGSLEEFPITTWTLLGRNVPVAGGAYFRILPYEVTREAFRRVNAAGHPAVFYLHPWEIDPDHPRPSLPWRIALTHYFNLSSTEQRLRRMLRDFHFAPMGEILHVH